MGRFFGFRRRRRRETDTWACCCTRAAGRARTIWTKNRSDPSFQKSLPRVCGRLWDGYVARGSRIIAAYILGEVRAGGGMWMHYTWRWTPDGSTNGDGTVVDVSGTSWRLIWLGTRTGQKRGEDAPAVSSTLLSLSSSSRQEDQAWLDGGSTTILVRPQLHGWREKAGPSSLVLRFAVACLICRTHSLHHSQRIATLFFCFFHGSKLEKKGRKGEEEE